MSSSLLRRIWDRICKTTYFIGRDLEGNKYYEYPNAHDGVSRTKRVVKYRRGYDMWTYIAGDKRLPVQWSSWLTHTRIQAPTLEELQADLLRQERMKMRVALISAGDRDAALSFPEPVAGNASLSIRHRHDDQSSQASSDDISAPNNNNPSMDTAAQAPSATPGHTASEGRKGTSDEPMAWTPRIARRRAGSP
ncbi:hypothetical protein BC835DRAFT_1303000 [Cytidiella melzeri]|nr:hypothetical protein BC835DRAFT_1303000 [Cytidiella melzeri]